MGTSHYGGDMGRGWVKSIEKTVQRTREGMLSWPRKKAWQRKERVRILDFSLEDYELFTVTREKGEERSGCQELFCPAKNGLHGVFELPSTQNNFSLIIFLKG